MKKTTAIGIVIAAFIIGGVSGYLYANNRLAAALPAKPEGPVSDDKENNYLGANDGNAK